MSLSFVIPEFNIGGAGTPPLQFFRRGFILNGTGGSEPSWKDIILHGNTALTLVNSKANGLNYLKLFGGTELLPETYIDSVTLDGKCEQNGTPTPTNPVDIVCNNGTISFPQSAVGTVTQTGTPTPDTPVEPVFYDKGGMVLRAIDTDADSYDSATQTITRAIGYHIFTGTESFGTSTAYGKSLYINNPTTAWGGVVRSKDVLCQYFTGTSSPSGTMPEYSCFFNTSGHFYFRTSEESSSFKSWLAELYANGTPLIVWFVKSTVETESYTPSIYIDGTTETVTDSNGLTATAQMLLSVGDDKDTQEVISGAVTRNVGIYVFDGTEEFTKGSAFYTTNTNFLPSKVGSIKPICTHFNGISSSASRVSDSLTMTVNGPTSGVYTGCVYFYADRSLYATANDFKQWLADQYANGTPVIVVYPTSSATTETVSGQFLSKSPVTYSGSISGLTGTVVESSHTIPTPSQPLDINCNNGVIKYGQYGKNLFDKTTMDTGKGWYLSSGVVDNNTANRTIVIDCKPNTKYSFWHTSGSGGARAFEMTTDTIALGDTGTWVTQSLTPTVTKNTVVTTYTTSANAKKLYILAGRTGSGMPTIEEQLADLMVVEGEVSTATPYEPYHFGIHTDGTVETVEVTGKNLFDKSTADANRIYGYFQNSGTVWTYVSSGFSVRIPCKPNTTYTARYNGNSTQAVIGFGSTYRDIIPTESNPYISVSQAIRQNNPTINTPITLTTKANDKWLIVAYNANEPQHSDMADNLQIEIGSTATTYESYRVLGTATAEMLLKVGDFQDVQSVIDGNVTRKIGIKVLTGSESGWTKANNSFANPTLLPDKKVEKSELICTHFKYNSGSTTTITNNSVGCAEITVNTFFRDDSLSTVEEWTAWLSSQYIAGTPVIVVYPLATSTTETVTAQPLTIQAGTNIVEITQASMDNLELEVSYKAGVEVTVTEIENAQLDNSVEVTVNG